jgi:hypothetical protein
MPLQQLLSGLACLYIIAHMNLVWVIASLFGLVAKGSRAGTCTDSYTSKYKGVYKVFLRNMQETLCKSCQGDFQQLWKAWSMPQGERFVKFANHKAQDVAKDGCQICTIIKEHFELNLSKEFPQSTALSDDSWSKDMSCILVLCRNLRWISW